MKKCGFFVILISFLVCIPALATQVTLTLESNPPATFLTVRKIIDIPDVNDQYEVSRQAALFALSPEGWNLQNIGLGGNFLYKFYPPACDQAIVEIPCQVPVPQSIIDLFGYALNAEALTYGATYGLRFQTDAWCEHPPHEMCEFPDNFGVIGACMSGVYSQCANANWGVFYIQELGYPVADAGPDRIVSSEATLDASNSHDFDGTIDSYEWDLVHRENPAYNQTVYGAIPVVTNLHAGFYDVTLTVTDNESLSDSDNMILACYEPTVPNYSVLNLNRFIITKTKWCNYGVLDLGGRLDMGNWDISKGDLINSRVTIEVFGVLPNEEDIAYSQEIGLKVMKDRNIIIIRSPH